ncbi:MAG TPA: glutathione S-transferase [Hyphomonadaceae bacterium]|nr:glutathione S-transferase [Hyphomonadaceae bacterium]
MFTIFHTPRSRSMRVIWLCEEMGAPYEVKPASFFEPTPEFLEANPLRTIPAFKDGDVRMTESIAIMVYMMEKCGPTDLAVKPNEPAYADYLQYLIFSEATAAAPANALIAGKFLAKDGAGENWTSGYIIEALSKRAAFLEDRLKSREFVAGDRFTAADIAIAYTIGLLGFVGVSGGEASQSYHERMTARPAYQRAAAIQ